MSRQLSADEIAELGCTYAALILHDDNIPITGDRIKSLLDAANVKVAPFWPSLFARVLSNKVVDDLILSGGSGGGGPAVATSSASTTAPVEEKEEKGGKGGKGEEKEKKKKDEPKEQSDEDMGFGLFD